MPQSPQHLTQVVVGLLLVLQLLVQPRYVLLLQLAAALAPVVAQGRQRGQVRAALPVHGLQLQPLQRGHSSRNFICVL